MPLILILLFLGLAGAAGGYYYFEIRPGKPAPTPAPTPAPANSVSDAGYQDQVKQAKALYNQEKFEEASQLADQLSAAHPQDASLHVLLGAAKWKIGQSQQALSEFQRAVDLDPKLGVAWQNMGLLLYRWSQQW